MDLTLLSADKPIAHIPKKDIYLHFQCVSSQAQILPTNCQPQAMKKCLSCIFNLSPESLSIELQNAGYTWMAVLGKVKSGQDR